MSRLYAVVGGALACGLVVMAGCEQPRSQVKGTVRLKGVPVPNVFVIFLAADNQTYTAATGSDGRYTLPAVPRGRVRVAVQIPESAPAQGKGRGEERAGSKSDDDATKGGKGAPVPSAPPNPALAKYLDPNSSGLAFELTEPDKEFDINLD